MTTDYPTKLYEKADFPCKRRVLTSSNTPRNSYVSGCTDTDAVVKGFLIRLFYRREMGSRTHIIKLPVVLRGASSYSTLRSAVSLLKNVFITSIIAI